MSTQSYIPTNSKITSWENLAPYFAKLITSPCNSATDLEHLIQNYSDVLSVFSENHSWAFVHMTCDTANENKKQIYETLAGQVLPLVKKAQEALHQKILSSPYVDELNSTRYGLLLKKFKNASQIFSPKNVAIEAELAPLESRYRQIAGGLTANIRGEELTLQQASLFLNSADRAEREMAWSAIQSARLSVKQELDSLFDRMLSLRHQMALNSGFANYRDFKHQEKERFDYTPNDCMAFQDSVKTHVMPLWNKISKRREAQLSLSANNYSPWDTEATPVGTTPLKPFATADELLQKGLSVFEKLNPAIAQNLKRMQSNNLFDLESRKDKAPGGYNCYLEITGMPFIFMNAAGDQREVVTLMHECGHATHNFLSNHDSLQFYRDFPTEMAETASMSMELMSMPYWQDYYPSPNDHRRAQIEQLEGIVTRLPWIALVDKFQHWIYLHPKHSPIERDETFSRLFKEFSPQNVNWQGFEAEHQNTWQKQLHIFEIPFYYIEYGIAQIGALQVYKNFKKDPVWALESYKNGLKLGGTKPLPELWQAMNIQFDFSAQTIRELMIFVEQELDQLYAA